MANEKRLIDTNELPLGKFVEPRTEWHQGWNDALDAAMLQAPTVDAVEVVHGRWEERYTPNGKYVAWDGFYCSICGKQAAKSNYCPNCGARMDGDGDG